MITKEQAAQLNDLLHSIVEISISQREQIEGLLRTCEYLVKCVDALEVRIKTLENR